MSNQGEGEEKIRVSDVKKKIESIKLRFRLGDYNWTWELPLMLGSGYFFFRLYQKYPIFIAPIGTILIVIGVWLKKMDNKNK